ncbi:MAG: 4-hydroxy-tetrahydrodipicolinate synthase [Desulfobacterales bacterium]|nr:4-hydroxy-tetrahydrodipicolinate synthase [Desulfobacterales bacterium]
MNLNGVILPVITPFINDKFDAESYKQLLKHYSDKDFSAIIPCATTGETSVLSDYERDEIFDITVSNVEKPIYFGIGGNHTSEVINKLSFVEKYDVEGILSVCPYYNKPSQKGIFEHFLKISENTTKDIIIYNIPYRTGVNLSNETLLRLAECKNIIGVKDSCGDISQSLELIRNKPENFSVLTGEDILFYTNIVNGGDGGILASSHLFTEDFTDIYKNVKNNDHKSALEIWNRLSTIIPNLFIEPNPAPLKYILNQQGLIKRPELRLPLVEISDELKEKIKIVGLK